ARACLRKIDLATVFARAQRGVLSLLLPVRRDAVAGGEYKRDRLREHTRAFRSAHRADSKCEKGNAVLRAAWIQVRTETGNCGVLCPVSCVLRPEKARRTQDSGRRTRRPPRPSRRRR